MSNLIEKIYLVDEIYKAQNILARSDFIAPTEITLANDLRTNEDETLWLSSEIHQSIKAYKIRGAANKIIQLARDDRKLALVAASAGNHAQAVALMARELHIPATIVMPSITPDFKVAKVDSFASKRTKVILEGETYDDSEAYAEYLAKQQDLSMIHPFNDPLVIAGQGTWGLEIIKSLNTIDNLYVPVGGGGLIAGMTAIFNQLSPSTRIVPVEPEGAASLTAAYEIGEPKELEKIDTFVDGASVKTIGGLPFQIYKDLISEPIVISNQETIEATRILNEKYSPRMVEFAGALSLAGYLKDENRQEGDTSLCLITGGNLSVARYRSFAANQ